MVEVNDAKKTAVLRVLKAILTFVKPMVEVNDAKKTAVLRVLEAILTFV